MLWICCRNDHVLPHLHNMFPQEGELLPEYNSGNPKYQYHSGREAIARIVFVQTVRNGIYRMILCRRNADLCVGSFRYFYSGGGAVAAQMAKAAGK